jgi:hypothetical protein
MKANNEDFTTEDILIGLYKLACIGAGKEFNIDLDKLEKASGRKLKVSSIVTLAKVGAETEDEREFVKVCESVLVKEEQCN